MSWTRQGAALFAASIAAVVGAIGVGAAPALAMSGLPGTITNVTGTGPGIEGFAQGVSASGRYVLTQVQVDRSAPHFELYVTDESTGQRRLVSQTLSGHPISGSEEFATISANGRYVAYVTAAPGLPNPPGQGTRGTQEVYRYDLNTGEVRTQSLTPTGGRPDAHDISGIAISADGRYVAYSSDAATIAGPPHGIDASYLFDNRTGRTITVTRGLGASDSTVVQGVSADGNEVALTWSRTSAAQLPRVYLWQRATGSLRNISNGHGRPDGTGALSADGSTVVYGTTVGAVDRVARYDVATGATTLIGPVTSPIPYVVGYAVPSVSANGRYVSYTEVTKTLITGVDRTPRFLRYDAQTGRTAAVYRRVGTAGEAENLLLSADGQHAVFTTNAGPDAAVAGVLQGYEWNEVAPH